MADYTSHNSHVFENMLTQYAENTLATRIEATLKRVAEKMVGIIDNSFKMPSGTDTFPVFTANLHDATGVGVYINGSVASFIPTKRATTMQTHKGVEVDGNSLLSTALSEASTTYSKGIWIVLFSAVPYAYKVDTQGSPIHRGVGFFEDLEDRLLKDVIKNLKPKKL